MYNSEQKTQFIQWYTSSITTAYVCETTFNAFEPYETAWGADLCTQTAEVLRPVVDKLTGLRVRSKWARVILLKDYVKWCLSHCVEGACDGMLSVEATGIDKLRRQSVSGPFHLQQYLNQICDPESQKTLDNVYRCYYWMAYGGIAEEDIPTIRNTDVDFQHMVIRYRDTEVPIYREAVQAFRNCVDLTQFAYIHPHYHDPIQKDRAPGDTLIRGTNGVASIKSIRVELSRRSKRAFEEGRTTTQLSHYRAWISGLFFRMYERECAGFEVDFSDAAAQFMEGRTYKLDSGRNTVEAKKRQCARDYMEDYQRWKLAFFI